jgi:hypothetical protein
MHFPESSLGWQSFSTMASADIYTSRNRFINNKIFTVKQLENMRKVNSCWNGICEDCGKSQISWLFIRNGQYIHETGKQLTNWTNLKYVFIVISGLIQIKPWQGHYSLLFKVKLASKYKRLGDIEVPDKILHFKIRDFISRSLFLLVNI